MADRNGKKRPGGNYGNGKKEKKKGGNEPCTQKKPVTHGVTRWQGKKKKKGAEGTP
ncbi:MAG: hypothetical protein WC882_02155 [Candidatus Gracilibacteria bacterium]